MNEGWDNFIHISDDLEYGHIDFHFWEFLLVVFDLFHEFEIGLKWLMTQQGDIFDIDKHLFHRDILFTTNFHLQLHAPDEYLVDTFVFFMELLFFVVESVENVFNIGYCALIWCEVVEQSLVENLDAAESLVYGFYLFEDESFLDLFEVEHSFEELGIFQLQKEIETFNLINSVYVPIGFEVIIEFFIEENFAIDMLRHLLIAILDEIDGISDGGVVMKLEYFLDSFVESLFWCISVLNLLNLLSVFVDIVVLGKPMSLEPDWVNQFF